MMGLKVLYCRLPFLLPFCSFMFLIILNSKFSFFSFKFDKFSKFPSISFLHLDGLMHLP